jgi:Uma2 family endonuclease
MITSPKTPLIDSEQRFILSDIAWQQYETLRSTLDGVPGLRLTYLQGCLEFFMPSPEHEQRKSILGRLIELFSIETNTRLYACGSTTYRKQAKERGLEADESYCINQLKEFPDLAIEVALDLRLYSLQDGEYEQVSRSVVLPNLEIDLLVRCALMVDQFDAAVAFRRALKGG